MANGLGAVQVPEGQVTIGDITFQAGDVIKFSSDGSKWDSVSGAYLSTAATTLGSLAAGSSGSPATFNGISVAIGDIVLGTGSVEFGTASDGTVSQRTNFDGPGTIKLNNTFSNGVPTNILITPGAAKDLAGEVVVDATLQLGTDGNLKDSGLTYNLKGDTIATQTVYGKDQQYSPTTTDGFEIIYKTPTFGTGIESATAGKEFGISFDKVIPFNENATSGNDAPTSYWGAISLTYNGESITFGTENINLTTFLNNTTRSAISADGQTLTIGTNQNVETYSLGTAAYTGAMLIYDSSDKSFTYQTSTTAGTTNAAEATTNRVAETAANMERDPSAYGNKPFI